MGKKDFVKDYDPLRAHLTRDAEKVAPPPPPVAEPVAPSAPASPPVVAVAAPESIVEALRSLQPAAEPPRRRHAPAAAPSRKVLPLPPPKAEIPTFAPEVSARIKVTEAAFQDLEAVLSSFHRATGSKIHYSIATRALWGLLVQAEAQVTEELRKLSLGRLPSTRSHVSYAEYEEKVRLAFASAFRKLPRSVFSPASAEGLAEEG
jgi:hypothetical protein